MLIWWPWHVGSRQRVEQPYRRECWRESLDEWGCSVVAVALGLLAWLLLSIPLAVVVGRGIAEAEKRAVGSTTVSPTSSQVIAS